jgi:hypothetical protein
MPKTLEVQCGIPQQILRRTTASSRRRTVSAALPLPAAPERAMSNRGKSSVGSMVSTLGVLILVVLGHTAFATNFGNALSGSWADTPQGKFACRADESTSNRQVLTLGESVVYQQPPNEDVQGGPTLVHGIRNENVGCPSIIASHAGYVVIVRDTQPPSYGIQGYAVINFNATPPTVTELAEGQRPGDEKIRDHDRIAWDKTSLVLRYHGYPRAQPGGSVRSPKPQAHSVRLDFASEAVSQLK